MRDEVERERENGNVKGYDGSGRKEKEESRLRLPFSWRKVKNEEVEGLIMRENDDEQRSYQ